MVSTIWSRLCWEIPAGASQEIKCRVISWKAPGSGSKDFNRLCDLEQVLQALCAANLKDAIMPVQLVSHWMDPLIWGIWKWFVNFKSLCTYYASITKAKWRRYSKFLLVRVLRRYIHLMATLFLVRHGCSPHQIEWYQSLNFHLKNV